MAQFKSLSLPPARKGEQYEAHIEVTGSSGTLSFSISEGKLPPPLKIGSDGWIRGAPTGDGIYGFTVCASDAQGAISQDFEIRVFSPLQAPRPSPGGGRSDPVSGAMHLDNGHQTFIPALMALISPGIGGLSGAGSINPYADGAGDSSSFAKPAPSLKPHVNLTTWGGGLGGTRAIGISGGRLAFAFEDIYKGGIRLNIAAHGSDLKPGHIILDAIAEGEYPLRTLMDFDAKAFTKILRASGFNFSDYDAARLIVCNSAVGGQNSFAAQFSKETGLVAKGFDGPVSTAGVISGELLELAANHLGSPIQGLGREFLHNATDFLNFYAVRYANPFHTIKDHTYTPIKFFPNGAFLHS